jgi:hypothetical protein
MKTLLTLLLVACLSSSLFAKDQYNLDFYHVNAYNMEIPALSLEIKPNHMNRFQLIFSYVTTLFTLEKEMHSLNDEGYSNLQISFNFQF